MQSAMGAEVVRRKGEGDGKGFDLGRFGRAEGSEVGLTAKRAMGAQGRGANRECPEGRVGWGNVYCLTDCFYC